MTSHPVKRGVLKHRDGRERTLLLMRDAESSYQWQTPNGQRWEDSEGLSMVYADEGAAIKALRVGVDGDPALVGCDLTIYPMDPPAEERAARKILDRYGFKHDGELADIIRRETNIAEITEHVQTLLAFLFTRRQAFAKALFPVVDGKEPRDMVLDGILLQLIEAMQVSTGQNYGNLLAILRKPVEQIITAHRMPPDKAGVN